MSDLFDHQGHRFLIAEHKLADRFSPELLSRSEFLALVYRAQAYPLKLIAHRCRCSQATASGLVKNACEKLGVNSIVGVAGLFGVGPAELSASPRATGSRVNRPERDLAAEARGTSPKAVFGQLVNLKPRDPNLSEWRISRLIRDSGAHVALSFAAPAPYATPTGLSRCQREVLELLLAGHDMARIGKLRSRSRHTIANQIASVYRLLGVNNRLELALLCRGLVP